MIRRWYEINTKMLCRCYGQVSYDELNLSWIRIHRFKLPPVFRQSYTALLIMTPGQNIENYNGYDFYLDKELKRKDKKPMDHIFDGSGFNDLSGKNYARLSLHLKSFRPALDVISGENLLDMCEVVYNHLGQRKGI
jgi:hypothetical protein